MRKISKIAIVTALLGVAGYALAAEINDISTTDASNTNSSYGFPENMAPSAVNDNMRAFQGIVARWAKDNDGSVISTGSANAYVAAANQTLSAYYDGLTITFEATFTNSATASLNVDSVGAVEIKKFNDQALVSGDIEQGQKVRVIYDSSTSTWQLQTPVANAPLVDPMSTRGDIIVRNSSNTTARLALGSVARVLASDGSDVVWSATASSIGKQTIFVPVGAMRPTASNGAASVTAVETTAGRPDMIVMDFDATSDEHAQFQVAFPTGWNRSTVTFIGYWTTTATDTDGVAIGLQCVSVADNDTIDVAYGTPVVVTDDALGAAEDLMATAESSAVTCAGSPGSGEMTFFRVFRDVSDANDDMTEDMRLIGIKVLYTVESANDS